MPLMISWLLSRMVPVPSALSAPICQVVGVGAAAVGSNAKPICTPPDQPPPYSVKTDKDGKFTLDKVKSGSFKLIAGDKARGVALRDVEVEAGKTVTVTLTLRRPPK